MRHPLAFALVVLSCHEEAAVGYVRVSTPDAAAPEAGADAAPAGDAEPFPAHGPRSGLTGVGSRGGSAASSSR